MSDQTFDSIIVAIAAGESANRQLRELNVNPREFWGYIAKDPAALNKYAHARSLGLERMAEEILDIADDESLSPDSRRVRVDPRKWLLSKLAPKRYGDHLELTVGTHRTASEMSDAELLQGVRAALPAVLDVQDKTTG
jgi:hypothetical protein